MMVPFIAERYFYIRTDAYAKPDGPYALGELIKMNFNREALIWRYGLKEWVSPSQLVELKLFQIK